MVDPTSPTSFNTLSNVYATAIDRSTPVTAINTKHQPLKIQTQDLAQNKHAAGTPFVSTYPETPLTAHPVSPAVANLQDVRFPSTMTATPPLSAGPADSNEPKPFSFAPADTSSSNKKRTLPPTDPWIIPSSSCTPTYGGRRATAPVITPHRLGTPAAPYTRNRSLHSILRNSPLPPPTARTPVSPRRQSQRLAEKAARRVGYESPIERVIVTEQYVHSHIDLLLSSGAEDAAISPTSNVVPTSPLSDPILGLAGDDTRDGGMTPGPFEEMRRRMAGLVTRTPTSPVSSGAPGSGPAGVRKRRKRESRRRWVWTIGAEEDDEEGADASELGGAVAAARAAAVRSQRAAAAVSAAAVAGASSRLSDGVEVLSPMDVATPSVETAEEADEGDVVMTESEPETGRPERSGFAERRAFSLTPADGDIDMETPTVARKTYQLEGASLRTTRQDSEGLFNPETGSRRDTPVPADLVPVE